MILLGTLAVVSIRGNICMITMMCTIIILMVCKHTVGGYYVAFGSVVGSDYYILLILYITMYFYVLLWPPCGSSVYCLRVGLAWTKIVDGRYYIAPYFIFFPRNR